MQGRTASNGTVGYVDVHSSGDRSISSSELTDPGVRTEHGNIADEQLVVLISRHQLPLIAFLRTMLRSYSDAEDVLQETNLVLWSKRQEYDPERPFTSWACRIAHLQALSFLKSRRSRGRVSLGEATLEEIAVTSSRFAEDVDQRGEQLRYCLQKLPMAQQSLLRSRYQGQMSLVQLAESLGKTPRSVSMSLYRLRNVLKECVERALNMEVSQ